MVKRDKASYVQLYIGAFIVVLFLVYVFFLQLYSFLTSPKSISNWITIAYYAIMPIIGIFVLKVYFVQYRERWLKIEQARLNVTPPVLYEPQPQPALPPLTTLALKKRPRAVDISLKVSLVCFCIGVLMTVVLIGDNIYAHQPLGLTTISILLLVGIGIAAFSLLVALIATGLAMLDGSVEIVAGEDDLLVRTGCVRRRVSWQQASLFAVGVYLLQMDALHIDALQWVELSSATVIARWPNELAPNKRVFHYFIRHTSDGKHGYRRVSKEEYQAGYNCLHSYIAQKTGLPLRDVRPGV